MTVLQELEQLHAQTLRALATPLSAAERDVLRTFSQAVHIAKLSLLVGTSKLSQEASPNATPPTLRGSTKRNAPTKYFRAPHRLRSMGLQLPTGDFLSVPANGVVKVAGDRADLESALCDAGFDEVHSVDACGKASDESDAAVTFMPHKLPIIGGPEDLFDGLYRRADVVPSEKRIESWDGPRPAAVHAESLSEFRKRYFGQ